MPELVEQMFCSQQIVVPPKFPYILKRYCKAAIKTQPYDLLRWSYEYFKALSQHRPPPVKLRLEYPVYSTEGGLTRGCLKVLANQLAGMKEVPLVAVKAAWNGFCLDPTELKRILCMCQVYQRSEKVPYLHFLAAAGGLLTKSLTHTMILLCESLTKEPDGGSAAIPVADFLIMYQFLARIDASADVKYINGYLEGREPVIEEKVEEEQQEQIEPVVTDDSSVDDYWSEKDNLQKLSLINAHVARSTRLSTKMTPKSLASVIGKIERSPSVERAGQIERENYQRDRRGRISRDEGIDKKLREMSAARLSSIDQSERGPSKVVVVKDPNVKEASKAEKDGIEIVVYNEDNVAIPYEFHGEHERVVEDWNDVEEAETEKTIITSEEEAKEEQAEVQTEKARIAALITELKCVREERRADLEQTFADIKALVAKYHSANYDLGMIAGRQMSTTSGEFVVQNINKEILEYIDDQIAVLPDPDLKKKKAKPDEIAMVREILEAFLDENMDAIAPEVAEEEEEESEIPEIITVYAVPGIGPPVDEDIINDFEEYALEVSKIQADVFMPRNIRHFLCPPLEKFAEHDYENLDINKEEELPTEGAIIE